MTEPTPAIAAPRLPILRGIVSFTVWLNSQRIWREGPGGVSVLDEKLRDAADQQ